ncbi:hypothetical protein, partial [Rhizobium dioscoreae]|uniref:hypothetical protein n=1 Tax=Rhizobium dioscoreae TaxID=2653122 RepID=UPI001AEE50F1
VYSLVQNVTVEVSFQNRNLFQSREASPPTFLFLLIFNCQITDQKTQSKTAFPPIPGISPEPPISIAANPGNTRARDFVASSAAALVSDRAYRPPNPI